MTLQEIVNNIKSIRENYINDNIDGEDVMEHLEDLCNDIKDSADGLVMFDDDDHYGTFEETDFTNLSVDY